MLRKSLEMVISSPKPRSSKWISSSIPESKWGTPIGIIIFFNINMIIFLKLCILTVGIMFSAKLSSVDYHVNNLLSPVLFHDALKHVPNNAIVIEIAPHCLLQAILKRSLPSGCTNVGLMKRDHENNVEFILSSIGKYV